MILYTMERSFQNQAIELMSANANSNTLLLAGHMPIKSEIAIHYSQLLGPTIVMTTKNGFPFWRRMISLKYPAEKTIFIETHKDIVTFVANKDKINYNIVLVRHVRCTGKLATGSGEKITHIVNRLLNNFHWSCMILDCNNGLYEGSYPIYSAEKYIVVGFEMQKVGEDGIKLGPQIIQNGNYIDKFCGQLISLPQESYQDEYRSLSSRKSRCWAEIHDTIAEIKGKKCIINMFYYREHERQLIETELKKESIKYVLCAKKNGFIAAELFNNDKVDVLLLAELVPGSIIDWNRMTHYVTFRIKFDHYIRNDVKETLNNTNKLQIIKLRDPNQLKTLILGNTTK